MGIILSVLLLLSAGNPTAGQPLAFVAEHDGANVGWFNLYVDGAHVNHVGIEALVSGTFTIPLPGGLSAGTHEVSVDVCTDYFPVTGGPACSAKTSITVVVDPALPGTGSLTPQNLRIIRVG